MERDARTAGPARLALTLPRPPTVLNTYRDIAVLAAPGHGAGGIAAGRENRRPRRNALDPVGLRPAQSRCGRSSSWRPAPKPGVVRPLRCELQTSDDGKDFRPVRAFETGWVSILATHASVTVGLDALHARFFRLLCRTRKGNAAAGFLAPGGTAQSAIGG